MEPCIWNHLVSMTFSAKPCKHVKINCRRLFDIHLYQLWVGVSKWVLEIEHPAGQRSLRGQSETIGSRARWTGIQNRQAILRNHANGPSILRTTHPNVIKCDQISDVRRFSKGFMYLHIDFLQPMFRGHNAGAVRRRSHPIIVLVIIGGLPL